jgi:hypothetical protein
MITNIDIKLPKRINKDEINNEKYEHILLVKRNISGKIIPIRTCPNQNAVV